MTQSDNLMEILRKRGAIYNVRRDVEGRRVTPLVGYAGKYSTPDGEKAFVGEAYFDFAMVEQNVASLFQFAIEPAERLRNLDVKVVLGMPMGGIAFAIALADSVPCDYACAEKLVTAVATETAREQSELVANRHIIRPRSNVALGEDVCNNFSTTKKAIELVESKGGKVVAIACAINRSEGLVTDWNGIPVFAALEIPMPQWQQDDPYVADDIAAGHVIWKPKSVFEGLVSGKITNETLGR